MTAQDIKIAIIDSVYDAPHFLDPDESPNVVERERYVDATAEDSTYHGTPIFNIITSTVYDADYYLYQAVDENGDIEYKDYLEAVEQAIEADVDVINLSAGKHLHGCSGDCLYCVAAEKAIDTGIIFVAAAGNDSPPGEIPRNIFCPGSHDEVITVGGCVTLCDGFDPENGKETDRPGPILLPGLQEDSEAYISDIPLCGQRGCASDPHCITCSIDVPWEGNVYCTSKKPEILAPVHIMTEIDQDDPHFNIGTSFAAPYVTGTIAAMLQKSGNITGGKLNVKEIKNLLIKSGHSINDFPHPKLNVLGSVLAAEEYMSESAEEQISD